MYNILPIHIKTHDSREAKKKQGICDEQVSYLHIAMLWNWLILAIKAIA